MNEIIKKLTKGITHNRYLQWYLLITFVGVAIYLLAPQSSLWSFWQAIDTAIAIALGVLAALAYHELAKGEDEIALYFTITGDAQNDPIPLGITLLRKACTRSEILGIMGMIKHDSEKRFNYKAELLNALLKELATVQKDSLKSKCMIPIDREDFDKYFADAIAALAS